MATNKDTELISAESACEMTAPVVKPYEKPVLVFYGDVRDVTLGPTLGTNESGCAAILRPGPGPGPGGCAPP